MAKSTVTRTLSDLSGEPVEESDAVEILVLSHPDLKRPVKLDAAPSEVASLKDIDKPLVRLNVDGQDVTVELAKFTKLFGKGVDVESVLKGAERVSEPSNGSRRAARKTSASSSSREDLQAMREWARGNGFEVADRGRISQEIQDAYAAR